MSRAPRPKPGVHPLAHLEDAAIEMSVIPVTEFLAERGGAPVPAQVSLGVPLAELRAATGHDGGDWFGPNDEPQYLDLRPWSDQPDDFRVIVCFSERKVA